MIDKTIRTSFQAPLITTLLVAAAPAFTRMVPALVISICVFPAFAWAVARIDTKRLGR